jgi:hypothetical protein
MWALRSVRITLIDYQLNIEERISCTELAHIASGIAVCLCSSFDEAIGIQFLSRQARNNDRGSAVWYRRGNCVWQVALMAFDFSATLRDERSTLPQSS